MNCEDVCELICAYLDNELEQKVQVLLEKHLEECPKCRLEVKNCKCLRDRFRKGIKYIKAPDNLRYRIIRELSKIDEYRETGIQALDLVHWGSHIAQLYEGESEMSELITPYIINGLQQNEHCVWVVSELSASEAKDAIKYLSSNGKKYLENGQLEIIYYKEWYLSNGHFDKDMTIKSAFEKYNDALNNGYSGLRFVGNLCWVTQDDWNAFIDYENDVNNVIADKKMLAMCSYNQCQCGEEKISDIINTHEYILFKENNSWRLKRQSKNNNNKEC
ncbi:MAG: MEDS domain-containing protein [Candidatus Poribacteria bacterium]